MIPTSTFWCDNCDQECSLEERRIDENHLFFSYCFNCYVLMLGYQLDYDLDLKEDG